MTMRMQSYGEQPQDGSMVALWRAVILNAVTDARRLEDPETLKHKYHTYAALKAYDWLTKPGNKNREVLCTVAQIHEDQLIARVRSLVLEEMVARARKSVQKRLRAKDLVKR